MTARTRKAVTFSVGINAVLTLLAWKSESAVFFYLLFPGAALVLLIEGGHGGRHSETVVAIVLGFSFLVNTLVYAAIVTLIFSILARSKEKATF
jgi:hypothetical protein